MNRESSQRRGVTIGNFDGVHRGHRAVLQLLSDSCRERNLSPLAVTFSSHPLELVAPSRAPRRLMSAEEKEETLRAAGVETLMLDFTEELRSMTAEQFMERLRDEYGMKLLVLGFDNSFGSDRLADPEEYKEIGRRLGIEVEVCTCLPGISSSSLRRLISEGEIDKANDGLGTPYTLSGRIVQGDHIGRKLGFPTANLHPDDAGKLIPAPGVYAGYAELPGGEKQRAVINIGVRPTVTSSGELRIEAHLLDFSGDLYGKRIILHFISRIRGEQKMVSLEALRETISADISAARNLL